MSSETRSPVPLSFQRRSSGDIRNLTSVSSSLLPAFGTVVDEAGYLQLRKYIIAPYDRRYRYVTKLWFPMDIASTLPFQLMLRGEAFGFLSLLRLWRLWRVSELFSRLEKDTRFSYFWTRFSKLICRDTINEILRYASKNRLPETLKEQMLAHMQLKFKTAELQQEEVLEDLPKAIRSSIAQHLFHRIVENAYLFKGVSQGPYHPIGIRDESRIFSTQS
ncbi:hypothetical protein L1049_018112 [Liquidambar formosana]|uniref:Ion transport domain-containing protein n=1 Tax=Liquidambar formosana TaxID=63359 RepID=A0AAP0NL43_LIQFO